LQHFAGVQADKKYQLADWRQRPLSEEMLRYAREDTHYLLYIYDRLKGELAAKSTGVVGEKDMVLHVFERSAAVANKRYEKPLMTPTSHVALFQVPLPTLIHAISNPDSRRFTPFQR